jgi:hypothetical protein
MPGQQALTERVSLAEAAGGQAPKGRRFRARIIQGDIQGSSGFYPAKMLKRDAEVFREGLPVFLDHPGATESYDRPERSVRDLAGKLATAAVYERDGLYADVEVYPHWAPVIEAMAGDIGMSIRASGTVEPSQEEGIRGPIVTSLTEAASVGFPTAVGAGTRSWPYSNRPAPKEISCASDRSAGPRRAEDRSGGSQERRPLAGVPHPPHVHRPR